jgi:hypothetical protein
MNLDRKKKIKYLSDADYKLVMVAKMWRNLREQYREDGTKNGINPN